MLRSEMASALVVGMEARLMFLKRGQMTRFSHSGQAKLDASKQGPAKSNSLQLSIYFVYTTPAVPVGPFDAQLRIVLRIILNVDTERRKAAFKSIRALGPTGDVYRSRMYLLQSRNWHWFPDRT